MMETICEGDLSSPVKGSFDVVVCGGGPAGMAAAIAAARSGATTLLLEVHGCLGGVWTAGNLCWLQDHRKKAGLMQEIRQRLIAQDGMPKWAGGAIPNGYDVEVMKRVLEEMAVEADIRLRVHTRVVAARLEGRRLTHVITESKSGREAWAGKVFVDATGDGDLAARAGCRFSMGRPESGETQPMSLLVLLTGLEASRLEGYYTDESGPERQAAKTALRRRLEAQGVVPSYGQPTLFRVHDDLFALMVDHQYGFSAIDADDITEATLNARREVNLAVDALRRSGPPFENVRLVATAAQIGVREGRRVLGRYTVTAEDLAEGRRHPDAICEASYRVTGNAVQMGENIGCAAARAALGGQLPHEWAEKAYSAISAT